MKNRLRWIDRETGRTEDVAFLFDEALPMRHVDLGLRALSWAIPDRPARYEIRPGH